ncbi:hypothetical protein [Leptospira licerasiae]|uniref:Lipoprotein n=1 Tax=Leptospira licerasiae str. MMD4847 TaxID=1049971 RepID=A0ABN0H949_9LEPT|nr:hypothetical protein [Leptospira licerasiae]EIE01415.1 hypothetical protein LEP1GSC185_3982 [Leptospira licerasiae serovar Varillal str. VAR 010]EJZ42260.1 hypothetical protein LEP1GSC178_0047 [Leptospira licerasiae str. MMD4847]
MKYSLALASIILVIFCKEASPKADDRLKNENEFNYDNIKVVVDTEFGSKDEFNSFLKILREKDCEKLKSDLGNEFSVEFNGYEVFTFLAKNEFKIQKSDFSVCQVFFDTLALRTILVQKGMYPSLEVVDDNLLSVRDYLSISRTINATTDEGNDGSKIKVIYFSRERGKGGIDLLLSLYLDCPAGLNQKCFIRKFSRG